MYPRFMQIKDQLLNDFNPEPVEELSGSESGQVIFQSVLKKD